MQVSHIVAIGCSLTFCQGLPYEKSWPYLIAKELQTNLVNLSVPGLGNDGIHRKAYTYFYQNLSYNNLPLFIIGLSDPWRREIWYKKHFDLINFHDYAPVAFPDEKNNEPYHKTMIENWDEYDFLRRTNLVKLSLINLFHANSIPYIITDMFPVDRDLESVEKYKQNFKPLNKALNVPTYIEPACGVVNHLESLPCGHYSENQCVVLKDFFVDKINKIYPQLTYTKDISYFPFSEYVKLDGYHQKFM